MKSSRKSGFSDLRLFFSRVSVQKMLTNRNSCGIITLVVEKVGVDDAEGPPVPIPNTEVKLSCAENSALATRCENREMPTLKVSTQQGGRFFMLFSRDR